MSPKKSCHLCDNCILYYLVNWRAKHHSEKGHTHSHVERHKSIRMYACISWMMPNLIQHQHVFPGVSFLLLNTCFLSVFSLQCARGVCVETVYISSFEWGNPLCTTDSVRHAVSKTGKSFCECHKLSQTYFQGHTATEILCMYFWDNSCKLGKSVSLWMWDLYLSYNLNDFFFRTCITAINDTCPESNPTLSNSSERCICKSITERKQDVFQWRHCCLAEECVCMHVTILPKISMWCLLWFYNLEKFDSSCH